MRGVRVWQRLLGVEHTVIEGVELVVEGGEEGHGRQGAADPVAVLAVLAVRSPVSGV